MKSIKDIRLAEITKGKTYWNCIRPIEEELMYFVLIDRFHDGLKRESIASTIGFGDSESLQVRCGGTIKGITVNLNYIQGMGFTSIWINPFFQNNPRSYHGYAIENFLEVDSQWGTKEDIIELVKNAHALGMRIFFDVVLNHTGDNWSYVNESPTYKSGVSYAAKSWRNEEFPVPTELRDFNRYSRKGRISDWENTPETWDGDIFELKDIVQNNSEIGQQNLALMIEIYSYWFALTDCDGFRIDAAKHIRPDWLNAFILAIKKFTQSVGKQDFFIFAEIIGNQKVVETYTSIDGYLDFYFYFSFSKKMLGKKQLPNNAVGVLSEKTPIRFLDNHDQIGQYPKQRIAHGLSERMYVNLLRAFLLIPGIPCLYYGSEQGLIGKGVCDGDIRECMFNPINLQDILYTNNIYYKTIHEFAVLRSKWRMFDGHKEFCTFKSNKRATKCIVLLISSLDGSKLLVYNLGKDNEKLSIKLPSRLSCTNKLIVYLYCDDIQGEQELYLVNHVIEKLLISPYGFVVLDL
jgi:glycosidase